VAYELRRRHGHGNANVLIGGLRDVRPRIDVKPVETGGVDGLARKGGAATRRGARGEWSNGVRGLAGNRIL
jgi:hypothetical protein